MVVVIVAAALLIAGGSSTRTETGTTGSSTSSAAAPAPPDFTLDGSAGTVTGDLVSQGAPGPVTTPGFDVRFLSFRDPAQGFAGPQLYVQVVRDMDATDSASFAYGDETAEAVTVAGRPGRLTVLGTVVLLGVPPSGDVGEGLLLVGYQLSEPQILRVAEGLQRGTDGTWTASAPPDALVLVADGVDTAPSALERRISITAATTTLELVVQDGDTSTFVGIVRDRVAAAASVTAATVAGRPAALVSGAGDSAPRSIVWQPTSTTVAELRGTTTAAQILAVAAGLRPAGG